MIYVAFPDQNPIKEQDILMNIDDFRYMWRGQQLESLGNEHAVLLAPINIRRGGKKRALLLLHGFGSSPAVYRRLMPAFSHYDAVVAPTLPGHGESITAFSTSTGSDWLSAAESSCEALVKEYEQVDVMGLSLGGLIACHLSQRFALHHLYLLAPSFDLCLNIPLTLVLARLLHGIGFKFLRNKAGNICNEQYSEIAYRQLPLSVTIEILSLIRSFKFVAPSCPVDLFLGTHDQVVDSVRVEKRFANLPNCKIYWLENSAHVLPLDNDVDKIIATVTVAS